MLYKNDVPDTDNPWENGEKEPSEYTWEEFLALDDNPKEAFVESFANPSDYDKWLEKVGQ